MEVDRDNCKVKILKNDSHSSFRYICEIYIFINLGVDEAIIRMIFWQMINTLLFQTHIYEVMHLMEISLDGNQT